MHKTRASGFLFLPGQYFGISRLLFEVMPRIDPTVRLPRWPLEKGVWPVGCGLGGEGARGWGERSPISQKAGVPGPRGGRAPEWCRVILILVAASSPFQWKVWTHTFVRVKPTF